MIENYYSKYNLVRTLQSQKRAIRNHFTYLKQFQKGFDSEIKTLEEKLGIAIRSGDTFEQKRIEEVLEKEKLESSKMKKEMNLILEIYPSVQDENDVDSSAQGSEEPQKRTLRDEKISDLYFSIRYKSHMKALERKFIEANSLTDLNEKETTIKALKREFDEATKVYQILGNMQKRYNYDKELKYQEYLESLERDRQARKKEEENQVKKALGPEFNPDMSHCKRGSKSYVWTTEIYDEPEKLFVGTTDYKIPQIDQEIYAYRFGTFEYGSLLRSDGTPTYTDHLCEIIGITKKDKHGNETTNFVIAPLRYVSSFTSALIDSKGRIVKEPIQDKRPNIPARKKGFFERVFDDIKIQSEKVKGRPSTLSKGSQNFPARYTRVLIPEEERYRVTPEEREFFGNIYLSDYLINNAVENNAHYLGTYTFDRRGKTVTFDLPKEDERIDACFFAQKNPGTVIKRGVTRARKVTVNSIESVFDSLRLKQQILSSRDMSKHRVSWSFGDRQNNNEVEDRI